jgi:hypothetical protein
VSEDRELELAQLGARLKPELIVEHPACVVKRSERFGLAAAPIEREDELTAEALTQRLPRDERRELRDEGCVSARFEVGVDSLLDCDEPQFLERPRLGGDERRLEPVQRLAVPERIGGAQQARALGRPRRLARLREERPETVEVELAGLEVQFVAVPGRRDSAAQGPPQPRDLRVHGLHTSRRRLVPELVDQALGRNHLVTVQQKVGE